MGMYNELNKVSRAINGQALELKKTQEQQKRVEYVKSDLKSMLQDELMDLDNIFNDDTKAIAIENVLNNTIVLLYNVDYTRQFLNDKYYIVARQVEQIKKKTETKDDYKQKIALEKWELQRQRERLKIQLEAEKLKQLQQKQKAPAQKRQYVTIRSRNGGGGGAEVLKIFAYITIAPFLIIILILGGFINAAAKSK